MYFTCRSFIGAPSTTSWAQYWENEPDDPTLTIQNGHLFGLISFTVDTEDQPLAAFGHDLIAEIDRFYYSQTAIDISVRLRQTIDYINHHSLIHCQSISLILAVVHQNNLHLSVFNLGNVALQRDDKISLVLTAKENTIQQLSGMILPKDKIFLFSENFHTSFGWDKIKTILAKPDISQIEEEFLSSFYSFPDQSQLAAALIQPNADDSDVIVYEPEAKPPTLPNPFLIFKNLKIKKSSVYVPHLENHQLTRRRRLNLFIVLVLLIALGISIYFGYQKNQSQKLESQYQQIKSEVLKKITDAKAVKNLNLDSALAIAKEGKSLTEKLTTLKVHQDETADLAKQIDSLLSQTGAADTSLNQLFYDTSLIVSQPSFSKMVAQGTTLYLLDNTNNRVDSLALDSKSISNISTAPKLKDIPNIFESGGHIYGFDTGTVYQIQKDNLETKITFSADKSITEPIDVQSYNGIFYLLDKSNIWKFTPGTTSFNSPQVWLQKDVSLPSDPVSLAINGKLWVLSANGQITPYLRGQKETFKSNQNLTFTGASNLIVSQDSDILAFTDSTNFVYVFRKSGEVSSKYNFSDKKIVDIALSDKLLTIYVLCSDQKIYSISL